MALINNSIPEFAFFPSSPPAVVGELATGLTVNIELWENGIPTLIVASGCSEINSTGRYTWSTSGIDVLTTSRQQFHWRMSDGGVNIDQGDFVLISTENSEGGMPSLLDKSSYIISG